MLTAVHVVDCVQSSTTPGVAVEVATMQHSVYYAFVLSISQSASMVAVTTRSNHTSQISELIKNM
eukprot:2452-Heterococcus_DN1.PRE.3